MAYCTAANIKAVISNKDLLDWTDYNRDGQINDALLSEMITRADVEIDSYINGLFDTPLQTVPDKIKYISIELTVYYIFLRKPGNEIPKQIQQLYDNAIAFLEKLRAGKVKLIGVDAKTTNEIYIETNKTSEDTTFTDSILSGIL